MINPLYPLIHVQTKLNCKFRIINLQNVANNLRDAFSGYKGVTKSWNPAINVPKRVEVHKKTTQVPSVVKRGKEAQTKKDNAPNKRPRKEKTVPLQKTVTMSQPVVDRHLIDIPQSSTQARPRGVPELEVREHPPSTLRNVDGGPPGRRCQSWRSGSAHHQH
jgi:hypothetical protein